MSKHDDSKTKDSGNKDSRHDRLGADTSSAGGRRPHVLFVCQSNGGKSQIAAALLRWRAGERVEVTSAGTRPADGLDEQARRSVEAIGASFDGEEPRKLTKQMLRQADRVVVLGSKAVVEPVSDMTAPIERWVLDEPSERGIQGSDRMDLVRDEIDAHVAQLLAEVDGKH